MNPKNILVRLISRLVSVGHVLEFYFREDEYDTEKCEPKIFKGIEVKGGISYITFEDGTELRLDTFDEYSLVVGESCFSVRRSIDEDGNFENVEVASKNLYYILAYVI